MRIYKRNIDSVDFKKGIDWRGEVIVIWTMDGGDFWDANFYKEGSVIEKDDQQLPYDLAKKDRLLRYSRGTEYEEEVLAYILCNK